ncbi:MAG: hypothetical protein F6K47_37050 [Symploca sp. SIO2E6]|nr:hypothetical protein [Symploca sp. SIO2E6]
MPSPIVKRLQYFPEREPPRPRAGRRIFQTYKGGNVEFIPGLVTDISAEQWETLKKDNTIAILIEAKALVEQNIPLPKGALEASPFTTIKHIVDNCTDADKLVELAQKATTPELQELVGNRADALSKQLADIRKLFPPAKKITEVSELTVDDARPVIQQETDLEKLQEWALDPRSSLRAIVESRIRELTKGATQS